MLRRLLPCGVLCVLLANALHAVSAEPAEKAGPQYADHRQLLVWRDAQNVEHPVTTPADWNRRREHILAGMQAAMGPLRSRENLPPLDVQILEEVNGDGFTRYQLTFVAEQLAGQPDRVPAFLYVPTARPAGKRLPAMLALHPTSPLGKRIVAGEGPKENRGYGLELAQRGYVVLCPDYPSFGDYPFDFTAGGYVSGSMKGIFNHMRCVDLLAAREEVDAERIGVIGHSLGGHNAMFVAAFDPRLKLTVSSCGWTPFHDYYGGKIAGWTSARYMPRLRDAYDLNADKVPFDFYEVVAALAPRAFFSNSPLRDANFDVAGVRKAAPIAQAVYDLLGASDRLQIRYPDSEHDFPKEVRREAYQFIDKAFGFSPAGDRDFGVELPRIPPLDPQAALKSIQVLDGFSVEQVACEPLVEDPVAISFDENGRMFVAEMCDYSEQAEERLGKIHVLEDTDGDGRFDKSTVFADGLSWPTAIICYDGGVFVGAAPDIWYLKDTDGDGRADVRRVVFTGFLRTNVQGLLNSFHWTLDNRIHGSASTIGGQITNPSRPKDPPLNCRGRDFSFDPRTFEIRAESGGAQHGLSFDDQGRKFVCSNSDHIQLVMYEDRYVARNPYLAAPGPRVSIAADGPQAEVFRLSPVEPWRIVRTRLRASGVVPGLVEGGGRAAGYFTGATGVTIYRGAAWPEKYRGQAFVGDVGSNLVHRKTLEPDGLALVAKRADAGREFLASTDIWFRPVQFANAPDGALYVLDMYREVIEHPASIPPQIKKHLDLTSGRDRGRIYRVVSSGFKQPSPVRLGRASTSELVAALDSRNGWHRDTASRLLFERQDKAAVGPLEQLAASGKLPEGRMHALYSLSGLGALKEATSLSSLSDASPVVRQHAARLSEKLLATSVALRAKLAAMVNDSDLQVRYQLAFTLGELPANERVAPLASLLMQDGADRWTRVAVLSSAADCGAPLLSAMVADEKFAKSPAGEEIVERLSAQIGARGQSDEIAAAIKSMEALPADRRALATSIVRNLSAGAARRGVNLRGHLATSMQAKKILQDLFHDSRQTASDEKASVKNRLAAIQNLSLGSFAEAAPVLAKLLENRENGETQLAAITSLGKFAEPQVANMLIDAWPTLTPRQRSAAGEALFSREMWLLALLGAVEENRIATADLDPGRLKTLETSKSREIRERAASSLSKLKLGRRQDVVESYRPVLSLAGDAARGKVGFQKICAACHRLNGTGFEIGPNLASMRSRGAEAILLNVLDPNREVNPQFVNYLIALNDGRTLNGLITAETASSLTLTRGENASDTVLRRDIDELRNTGMSIMPEGIEKQIDPQAMADLIAYVLSAK